MHSYKHLTVDEIEDFIKINNVLDTPIYDYIAGGAGNEWGVTNNKKALKKYHIVPRVLQDVSNISTMFEIFGVQTDFPVIIGPCAFHKLVCREGELATARAAADANIIMTLSTMSTYSIEDVANASNFPKWFQLYIHRNPVVTLELIRRAEKLYSALVVTIDVPAMGMRTRDMSNHFCLPKDIEAVNFKNLNILSNKIDGSKIKAHTDQEFEDGLTWATIDWIQSKTKLPLILKGILHPDDAKEALKHNIAGIIVSNHGGRQVNNVVAAIDALVNIAEVVNGKIPLIVDGGFRSGEDIFKALALGAQAVMIARPVLWGLALNGKKGVDFVFE